MKPENIINDEIIGLSAHITESTDPTLVSRMGLVVNETRETFTLLSAEQELVVSKSVCVFDLELPSGITVRVDGNTLRGTSEDRLKKRMNRRW
jgi:RNase P/RNase MRP subunit p29